MNTEAEFWACVDKNGPVPGHYRELGPCWMWTRGKTSKGYGIFNFRGRQTYAHRFAFLCKNGPLNPDMDICHHCDTPPCVRPPHLFQGTTSDNIQDMWNKNRHLPRLPGEHFTLDIHLVCSFLASRGTRKKDLAAHLRMSQRRFNATLSENKGDVTIRFAKRVAAALQVDLLLLQKKPLSEDELTVRLACAVLGPPFHNLLLSSTVSRTIANQSASPKVQIRLAELIERLSKRKVRKTAILLSRFDETVNSAASSLHPSPSLAAAGGE